jgi:hypothetical protein
MFNLHHNDYLGTGDCMVVRYEQRALELVLVPVWVNEEGPEGMARLVVILCVC